MSGHSKWSQIKRAKGAADLKRSAVFSKLSKKISVAARGGGDPAHNFKLRLAIEKAKEASMPNDNIERAVKKGAGIDGGAALEEITYEGYGPGGAALLIETTTDNKNRTVQSVKHLLSKYGGSLGAQGSVAWQFSTKGQIVIERSGDMDAIELAAIEAGAIDIESSDEGIIVYTNIQDFESAKDALQKSGARIAEAELTKVSSQPTSLNDADSQKLDGLIAILEDNEDVTAVHTNVT